MAKSQTQSSDLDPSSPLSGVHSTHTQCVCGLWVCPSHTQPVPRFSSSRLSSSLSLGSLWSLCCCCWSLCCVKRLWPMVDPARALEWLTGDAAAVVWL